MKNVSKRYGQLNVLQDLNMNIMPSSITGLLGPNGSGKTTIYDSLFRNLNVEDNLRAVAEIFLKNRREIEEKVENLLSEFSLTEQRKTLAHSLSGGQKKKVAICRALIGECRIMVLDEPLSNIDPITIEMIKDLIVKLQLTRSITILISDHAFENVLQIADEIKILSDGYILSEGSPASVVKDVRAREKYFGVNY